jgi:putative ABC transport system permease protein
LPDNLLPLLAHAYASVRRLRYRSLVSTAGVICGVVSFIILMTVGEGAKQETVAQIERLGINNVLIRARGMTQEEVLRARGLGSQGLALSDARHLKESIDRIDRVAAVREIRTASPGSLAGFSSQVLAVTPNLLDIQNLGLGSGRFLVEADVLNGNQVCVLGSEVARRLGEDGRPGGILRLNQSLYRVVGVLKHAEGKQEPRKNPAISARDFGNTVLVPLGDAAEEVSELVVALRSGNDVLGTLPRIRRRMEVLHRGAEDYGIIVPRELLRQETQAQSTFNWVLGIIALISLVGGGVGVTNTMLASIVERTHEIGIRRAIGATREQVIIQFLAEAVFLTLAGVVIGVLVGLAGIGLLSLFVDWKLRISFHAVAIPLLASALVGVASGLYPARKAARMDPIEALRG